MEAATRAEWQAWNADAARAIIARHAARPADALIILHALQAEYGWIPDESVPLLAQALNLSRAEVVGLISFYPDFRSTPPGRRVLRLCRAEACQAMGGAALAEGLLRHFGIAWGQATADGELTIEPVFCLGLCACAPAAMLDEAPLGRVDQAAMVHLLGAEA